jgi:Holliday junction resolvase RusA-like endonuclease
MHRVNIKPLSNNDAWKGRRFRSDAYKNYQNTLKWLLPKNIEIPEPPYEIHLKFGFSNKLSDWDNPIKQVQDCIAEQYKFNDKLIRRGIVDTEIVPKGSEFFEFEIKHYEV